MLYNVNLIGRVGTDAETVTTGKTPFISCRVAVDENIGKEKSTRWVTLYMNMDRFKNMMPYLKKGKLVFASGQERVSTFTRNNGEVGIDTVIWVDRLEFVSTGQKQEGTENASESEAAKEDKNKEMEVTKTPAKKGSTAKAEPVKAEPELNGAPEPIDDLPF
jgi:single-stranded DNA-binding protein